MIKRFLGIVPVLFGVVLLTFLLVHSVPGDPVEVMLGESASSADRMQLRSDLGLDQPIYLQFGVYLNKLAHGDLGVSIHSKKPIVDLLAERLPATAKLALLALSFAILIGLPLGVVAALRVNQWPDKLANFISLSISAMPHFWMGPMLMMVFAIWLGLLPVSGMERSVAKGLAERSVVLRHVLRAALLPIVTVLGLQLGSLLAGTVITETIFSWDGIGRLLVESIEKRDYPVTQACVLVVALVYVMVNLATDIIYIKIDPRVRFAS